MFKFRNYETMSPGPTEIPASIMEARMLWAPNPAPSLDPDFLEFYHETADRVTRYVGGTEEHETVILSGEAMLALEACVASLTEPGDRVLVLDNGIFGASFTHLVETYGGTPVVYKYDYRRAIDPIALGYFLEGSHYFKYATLVHCDTPSGVLNPIRDICIQLKRHGVPTVVDAVASVFGDPVDVKSGIDFLCGGTQKALSAPAGLSFVTVSADGKALLQDRKSPVPAVYANLNKYLGYYEARRFPYTMPAHDILGMAAALDIVEADPERLQRHDLIGRACRAAVQKAGLELYPQNGFANTVTAICVPEGVAAKDILTKMRDEHGILLAGSLGELHGKVFRIGHMGHNCEKETVIRTLTALQTVLMELGVPLEAEMAELFSRRC